MPERQTPCQENEPQQMSGTFIGAESWQRSVDVRKPHIRCAGLAAGNTRAGNDHGGDGGSAAETISWSSFGITAPGR